MEQELVSEAVVIWSGRGRKPWPTRDLSRLADHFGPELAADLAPIVTRLELDFCAADPSEIGKLIDDGKDVAATKFRALHPEISDDAVEALWWCYTYDWK